MLIEDANAGSGIGQVECPHCHLNGISDNLVFCPRCGWRLKGQLAQVSNALVGLPLVVLFLFASAWGSCILLSLPPPSHQFLAYLHDNLLPLILGISPAFTLTTVIMYKFLKARARKKNAHTVHVSYDE